MSETIVNKVANSGLITLNLEDYLPSAEMATFDIKDHLFMGLILKEKDFREALRDLDWSTYAGKNVSIVCTADAIVPLWAYMLVVTYLQPVASEVFVGTQEEMQKYIVLKNIGSIDTAAFTDQRIVVKGCGDVPVENYAYAAITSRLLPVVKSIMYGEPCSTVPIYKKK
ncbi:MAG TPA: DUF2480 family protein [Flavisolibacter sp.]|nr:DUF2480 family protein [Flavisolibacter sp.]